MLTSSEKGRPIASRVKGRPALVKRLRALLLAVHRFARGRARSSADIQWSAAMLDVLTTALRTAEGNERGDVALMGPPTPGTQVLPSAEWVRQMSQERGG